MRRLPLLSILLLAACAPQAATNPSTSLDPHRGDHPPTAVAPVTPTTVEGQPTTTVLVEEHPDRIEVLEARVTATTVLEDETTTTTKAPAKTTTTAAPSTTRAPAPDPTPEPTEAQGGFSSAKENDFASRINALRSDEDVAQLSRNGGLDDYARNWAKELAQAGRLNHSNFGSLLGTWSTVGENVGYGGSVEQIFSALVNSGGHYANMVAEEFTHFGIGVYVDDDGVLWTAHVFAG